MHTSKLYKYTVLDTVLIELDWKKKEDYKTKIISICWTAIHVFPDLSGA